jgi:hypothetical protein
MRRARSGVNRKGAGKQVGRVERLQPVHSILEVRRIRLAPHYFSELPKNVLSILD